MSQSKRGQQTPLCHGPGDAHGLRVLFAAPVLAGGIASMLRTLIAELERQGVRCAVYGLSGSREAFTDVCSGPVTLDRSVRLRAALLERRHAILHCTATMHQVAPFRRTLTATRRAFRLVYTFHGGLPEDCGDWDADAFTAVSPSCARAHSVPDGKACDVIPNAVDTTAFRPTAVQASARPILLWVGRTVDSDWRSKDVHGFLHLAASGLAERYDLVVVDEADRRDDLGLAEWLQGRTQYRWGLSRGEMAHLYSTVAASGGAWVSTSRSEGFPMCLLEAWACGCPVVVPNVQGFDYVRDGVNGLAYDRGAGLAGLMACVSALQDDALRARIVTTALEEVRSCFSPQRVADQYLSLYRRVLANGRDAGLLTPVARAADRVAGLGLRAYARLRGLQ